MGFVVLFVVKFLIFIQSVLQREFHRICEKTVDTLRVCCYDNWQLRQSLVSVQRGTGQLESNACNMGLQATPYSPWNGEIAWETALKSGASK